MYVYWLERGYCIERDHVFYRSRNRCAVDLLGGVPPHDREDAFGILFQMVLPWFGNSVVSLIRQSADVRRTGRRVNHVQIRDRGGGEQPFFGGFFIYFMMTK